MIVTAPSAKQRRHRFTCLSRAPALSLKSFVELCAATNSTSAAAVKAASSGLTGAFAVLQAIGDAPLRLKLWLELQTSFAADADALHRSHDASASASAEKWQRRSWMRKAEESKRRLEAAARCSNKATTARTSHLAQRDRLRPTPFPPLRKS